MATSLTRVTTTATLRFSSVLNRFARDASVARRSRPQMVDFKRKKIQRPAAPEVARFWDLGRNEAGKGVAHCVARKPVELDIPACAELRGWFERVTLQVNPRASSTRVHGVASDRSSPPGPRESGPGACRPGKPPHHLRSASDVVCARAAAARVRSAEVFRASSPSGGDNSVRPCTQSSRNLRGNKNGDCSIVRSILHVSLLAQAPEAFRERRLAAARRRRSSPPERRLPERSGCRLNSLTAYAADYQIVPIIWRATEPAPDAVHSGTQPRMNANEVIRTGRRRSLAASSAASARGIPLSPTVPWWQNSTIRIAFLAAQTDQHHQADLRSKRHSRVAPCKPDRRPLPTVRRSHKTTKASEHRSRPVPRRTLNGSDQLS